MANSVQNVSFTGANDYGADIAQIERQRKLAEALQAQAMQPIEQQTAGGWVVPISPLQGVGKLAQAWVSGANQRDADKRQKELAARYQGDQSADFQTLMGALQGRKAQTIAPDPQEAQQSADQGTPEVGPVNLPAQTASESLQQALGGMRTPQGQQMAAQYLLKAMMPEEKFGHTPQIEMVNGKPHAFMYGDKGTKKDMGPITPREALALQNTGGNIQGFDRFTGAPVGQGTATTMNPGEQARLSWDQYQWANLSPEQRARLQNEGTRIGLQRSETFFNTGMGATGGGAQLPANQPMPKLMGGSVMGQSGSVPMVPSQVPVAPRPPLAPAATPVPAPQAAPAAAPPAGPALPPRALAEIEAARRKDAASLVTKRDFNMEGLNAALDKAEQILKGQGAPIAGVPTNAPKPTSSLIGSGVDAVAGWFGKSPDGAPQADQLRALGGVLVAKMPRMEGPQSDRDVMQYREMAGQIGDSSIPIERRLAALKIVRSLFAKYDKSSANNVRVVDW